MNPELPNSGYAQFIVMTRGVEARERVRSRLLSAADEQCRRFATCSSTGTTRFACSGEVDHDKTRARGLTPAEVSLMTQAVMNGATLSQLREGEAFVDVVARAVPEERLNLDTVRDVSLYMRQGTVVPL